MCARGGHSNRVLQPALALVGVCSGLRRPISRPKRVGTTNRQAQQPERPRTAALRHADYVAALTGYPGHRRRSDPSPPPRPPCPHATAPRTESCATVHEIRISDRRPAWLWALCPGEQPRQEGGVGVLNRDVLQARVDRLGLGKQAPHARGAHRAPSASLPACVSAQLADRRKAQGPRARPPPAAGVVAPGSRRPSRAQRSEAAREALGVAETQARSPQDDRRALQQAGQMKDGPGWGLGASA